MDIITVRIAFTLASFAIFLCIIAWAVSPSKQRDFDEAARIPLGEDD